MADLVLHDHQPSAFLVYLHLWYRSAGSKAAVRTSHREMVDATGLSKSAVQAAIRALSRRRLIRAHAPDGDRRAGVHRAAAVETVMFSLHVDTARTWRGGQNQVLLTVNGLRSIGQRARSVAHPDGELRRRAAEGLELIPIAPRTEMDLSAAWKFSRLIKRLRPDVIHAHDPHGVAMAALALSIGIGRGKGGARTGARRRPPRRLSSEGQFVFALEVPAGRLLHRRIRDDSSDAGCRRRARRSYGDGARRDRRRARDRRTGRERARGVLAAARLAGGRQRRRAGAAQRTALPD